MRIGVVPCLDPAQGGVYQYTLSLLEALEGCLRTNHHWAVTLFLSDRAAPPSGGSAAWTVAPLWPGVSGQLREAARRWLPQGRIRQWIRRAAGGGGRETAVHRVQQRPHLGRWLRAHGVDWMLYTAPDALSFEAGVPYVMPVHDLQHRLQPEFPEVSADGEWGRREYLFRHGTRHARFILADSDTGREDLLACYEPSGLSPDRVLVWPFCTPGYLRAPVSHEARIGVRRRHALPPRYLFYPAQFWPHKNHQCLVEALGRLRVAGGPQPHLVLVGSATGRLRTRIFRDLMRAAEVCGVASQLHYLGYVDNEEMPALYAEAVGLVMPTFFGPTNLPVLEAWTLGCPVLTSDLRGIREQAGDAALLTDPRSADALAEGMARLWDDDALRRELVQCGRRRVEAFSPGQLQRRMQALLSDMDGSTAPARVSGEPETVSASGR